MQLRKLKFADYDFNFIWRIDTKQKFEFDYLKENNYSIFGIWQDLGLDINWHQDKFSDFEYPRIRFDKINAAQYFNKGIDLVFPWEQSRFYFGTNLARKYLVSKNENYYFLFRSLIEKWIENNPFLYGVNWLSTMDASIRAVNWIVSLNMFSDLFSSDHAFKNKISKSLVQHAEYISQFPLIEKGGLTTNHTTSAYTGLLFLSLTLLDHPKSEVWTNISKKGLESCIDHQVYEDGVDFEGSIPYHRLVLEFFAYSVVVARANNIDFSTKFYGKLFKMFEFCAGYINKRGDAPQIGDNDSGRLLVFNDINNDPYINEHDHKYLLTLGEQVYNFKFSSTCPNRDDEINTVLPKFNKINLAEVKITPRNVNELNSFQNGGAYFLKNDIFELCYANFPTGQNGKGGHNHLDTGSFTLSLDGNSFIVDPGSFGYSRDRSDRDLFRSYTYHNTIYNRKDLDVDLSKNGYWSLKSPYSGRIVEHDNYVLEAEIILDSAENKRLRRFEIFENKLTVSNEMNGLFFSKLNFLPSAEINILNTNQIIINKNYKILIHTDYTKISMDNYFYSPFYGKREISKCLVLEGKDNIIFDIVKVTA